VRPCSQCTYLLGDEARVCSACGAAVGVPAKKSKHAPQKKWRTPKGEHKALIPFLSMAVLGPLLAGGMYLYEHRKETARQAAVKPLPSDELLARYSFAMTPAEASALFGVDAKPGGTIKFKQPAVFDQVELVGLGTHPTYGINLNAGAKFDTKRVLARLAKVAPFRLHKDAAEQQEIVVGKSLLRLDARPTPMYRARIQLMTWVAGERGIAAANAFFSALRYAALDGPELTPAELRIVAGTPLAEAARFDVLVPIDTGAKRFAEAFPTGECQTQTDLSTQRTELVCTVELAHPIFAEARYAWPSVTKAHLQRVTFLTPKGAAPRSDPGGCLASALGGPGEKKVVDFASGQSQLSWRLGTRGDRVVFDGPTVEVLAPDGAKPEETPAWTTHYTKIVDALVKCAR
jgi:hypothetical protein